MTIILMGGEDVSSSCPRELLRMHYACYSSTGGERLNGLAKILPH